MIRRALVVAFFLFGFPVLVTAQTSSDRAALYQQRCASCHGKNGRGDGEYAGFLNPRPRDFTTGRYKFRSTETGSLPTDEDITHSITEGLHGTSMPSWKPFLSSDQIKALIGEVKSFSSRFASEQPQPIKMSPEPPVSLQNIDAGRAVYEKLKCAACHGTDGRETGAIAHDLKDDWGRPTRATDLTEPWAFRGGRDVRDIFLRFRTGMNGTPMPSFLNAATEPELWQLAVYIKSLGRKPLWETKDEAAVTAFYRTQQETAAKDMVRHGEYIATIAGCAFCHSPFRDDNTMIDELKYAGGQKFDVVPFGTAVTSNLTSDKESGLGDWTDDEIKKSVAAGLRHDGSRMLPYPMPWANYANMKPDDLNALLAFLRSLPPVSNRIPPWQPRNIASYLAGKFSMVILRKDPPVYVFPGNAGSGGRR